MAGVTWILSFICVAGGHLTSASPVPRSALVVQAGQNISLTCNLTSVTDITWYLLRSDQLLPLLTVILGRFGEDMVNVHTADRRINSVGALESGPVALEILEVKESDAGLYFCLGRCAEAVCVNTGIHLAVNGVDKESARQPCFILGIYVLVALLVLCVVIIVGFYWRSGKPAVCCCSSEERNISAKVTEDQSVFYSSLNLADKLCPSGQGGMRSLEEKVIYSTVKNPKASRQHS